VGRAPIGANVRQMAAWPPSQGDRKGRPYYTTNRPAKPVYSRGRACPCPIGVKLRREKAGLKAGRKRGDKESLL